MQDSYQRKNARGPCARFGRSYYLYVAVAALGIFGLKLTAQSVPAAPTAAQANASSFQGSVQQGEATDQVLPLTLDDAIQRGLRNNLGVILSGTQTRAARAQRLSELQGLL